MPAGPSELIVFLPNRPFFGASLVLVPALLHLRRAFPGTRLLALANHGTGRLFAKWGLADEVLRYDFAGGSPLACLRRTVGRRAAAVITCRPRSEPVHAWSLLIPTRHRRCFAHGLGRMIDPQARRWDVTRYKALTYLGLVGAGWHDHTGDLLSGWDLLPPTPQTGHLCLIPSGSSPDKKWPLGAYAEIARRWRDERGTPVQVLAGPDDPEIATWAEAVGLPVVIGGLPAEAACIRGAAAVVGNDCGPNHIAQLMDRPRVVLFPEWGDPREWFRPGARARVLQPRTGEAIATIDAEQVWQALVEVA